MSKRSQESYSELSLPEVILKKIEVVSKKFRLNENQKKKLVERVKEEFFRSSFEPGEAIGIIAAQSISEPATQMCVSGEERVLLKVNGTVRIERIGDFVNRMFERYGFEKVDNYEVCDIPKSEEVYALGLDQDEKLRWGRITSCVRLRVRKDLLRVKTRSGRRIVATDSHSFVTRKNNRIEAVRGCELRKGDRIPVIKYLPMNCTLFIKVTDSSPDYGAWESRLIPKKVYLDHVFGWFIGAYLSEGSVRGSKIRISNANKSLNNMKAFVEMMGIGCRNRGAFKSKVDVEINSRILSRFIVDRCGKGSSDKKVPEFAYSAPEGFVSALLRSFFDENGRVSVGKRVIEIRSNSEELIDGIKLLLARFGIFACKRREKEQFYLSIPYKYTPIFLEKIGCGVEEKRKKLEELSKLAKESWNRSRDLNDMVCGFGDILYRIAKKLRYPTKYFNRFTKRQRIGKATLYRYVKLFEKLAKERGVDVDEELEVLRRMLDSDVVWDEIIEISYVKPRSEYVYDISVDGLRTFTTFDGIVTHNTMRTYHFAGSAGIQVTLGLPRLIEIFDAKKVPETPMMTVYFKEKYNNKKDVKRFAERIKEHNLGYYAEKVLTDFSKRRIRVKLKGGVKTGTMKEILGSLASNLRKFKVKLERNFIVIDAPEDIDFKKLYRLSKNILNLRVSGIKGIKNVIVRREGKDWVVNTLGSNLEEILLLKEVDVRRTSTNNIHEVERVLGIEAARNVIIREAVKTMRQQGLNVDIRHIILVADIMTFTGTVKPIGRYGVVKTKTSILARAGFEETLKHLTRAAVRGEVDEFKGIFENVMIGQVVPTGTGMFELVAKFGEKE